MHLCSAVTVTCQTWLSRPQSQCSAVAFVVIEIISHYKDMVQYQKQAVLQTSMTFSTRSFSVCYNIYLKVVIFH